MKPAGLDNVSQPELKEFIEDCIKQNPDARPEARQLLKHPFFESIRNGKLCCPGVDKGIVERNVEGLAAEALGAVACSVSDTVSIATSDDEALQLANSSSRELCNADLPAGALPRQQSSMSPQASSAAVPMPMPTQRQGSVPRPPSSHAASYGSMSLHPHSLISQQSSPLPSPSSSVPNGHGHHHHVHFMLRESLNDQDCTGAWYGAGPEPGGGRQFMVSCTHVEGSHYSFVLRMLESEGHCKTIEFAYDSHEDTAECVATEMMTDLSLSRAEADVIQGKITLELQRVAARATQQQQQAALLSRTQSLSQSPTHPTQHGSSRRPSSSSSHHAHPEDLVRVGSAAVQPVPEVLPSHPVMAARASVPAMPVVSDSPTLAASPRIDRSSVPAGMGSLSTAAMPYPGAGAGAGGSGVGRSGAQTPPGELWQAPVGKAPSIHALIAAMREVHEEEALVRSTSARSSVTNAAQLGGQEGAVGGGGFTHLRTPLATSSRGSLDANPPRV